MIATLNELAEILAERAGRQFDIPFREEMKVLAKVWRSRLLRDSLQNNPKDRAYFRQYIEVPMEIVNISELPGFPDRPVMRSKCTLPEPVRANNIYFDYVGSVDKLSQFQLYTEQHEIIPALNARYTGSFPKVLWLNGYLWAFNTRVPYLGVSGVYDNPDEVKRFKCNCDQNDCYNDDMPFPISGDIQQRIIQAILGTELRANTPAETLTVPVNAPNQA